MGLSRPMMASTRSCVELLNLKHGPEPENSLPRPPGGSEAKFSGQTRGCTLKTWQPPKRPPSSAARTRERRLLEVADGLGDTGARDVDFVLAAVRLHLRLRPRRHRGVLVIEVPEPH